MWVESCRFAQPGAFFNWSLRKHIFEFAFLLRFFFFFFHFQSSILSEHKWPKSKLFISQLTSSRIASDIGGRHPLLTVETLRNTFLHLRVIIRSNRYQIDFQQQNKKNIWRLFFSSSVVTLFEHLLAWKKKFTMIPCSCFTKKRAISMCLYFIFMCHSEGGHLNLW